MILSLKGQRNVFESRDASERIAEVVKEMRD